MRCIGVDVSKQEPVTYDGEKERVFPNAGALSEFAAFVGCRDEVLVVFEPTSTYSRRLEAFCRDRSIPVLRLNPRLIPNLRVVHGRRSKTDRTDAELLYRYGVERGVAEAREIQTGSCLVQTLSAHLAVYRVTQKARIAHQGVFEALSQDPSTPKTLLDELAATVESLKERESVCIVRMQELVLEEESALESLQVLSSIPGVGPITAVTLLTLFLRYPGSNRRQIVALAGLDPVEHQSGSSVHKRARISKRGNREVRKRLYEATLSAARFNPAVKNIYHRLKERGKPEKVARIAAARKLLLIAHAIYKSGEVYREPGN
jgi:transposase